MKHSETYVLLPFKEEVSFTLVSRPPNKPALATGKKSWVQGVMRSPELRRTVYLTWQRSGSADSEDLKKEGINSYLDLRCIAFILFVLFWGFFFFFFFLHNRKKLLNSGHWETHPWMRIPVLKSRVIPKIQNCKEETRLKAVGSNRAVTVKKWGTEGNAKKQG